MSSTSERFNPAHPNMGDPLFEKEVRQEAYRLWEQAGRPDGRDLDFWYLAIRARCDVEHSDERPGIEAAGRPVRISDRGVPRRG